jgi:hypothetical protein
MVTSSRLKCSKHDVFLVLQVHLVMRPSGCQRVEFWQCPWRDCGYSRAHKHQKKVRKTRGPRAISHKSDIPKPADDRQASFSF